MILMMGVADVVGDPVTQDSWAALSTSHLLRILVSACKDGPLKHSGSTSLPHEWVHTGLAPVRVGSRKDGAALGIQANDSISLPHCPHFTKWPMSRFLLLGKPHPIPNFSPIRKAATRQRGPQAAQN